MEKGNVIVIGNSGVGKSTLINAVLGEDVAHTSFGASGTTKRLELYENSELPFRLIDTVGFEPSPRKRKDAIKAVDIWSQKSLKDDSTEQLIHAIWFCVDGTSSKLFPETIDNLIKATKSMKGIPIIVVITKSYAQPDREKNIEMITNTFSNQKRKTVILSDIIPVVAETFSLNEYASAPPEGITELIDATNMLLPEGLKSATAAAAKYKLNRKRAFAHSIVGASTATAATVGAVPIPLPDAMILAPLEIGMLQMLATIYGINKDEQAKQFFSTIVEVGTVSMAAKQAINLLKLIPGLNAGAIAVNAIVAGSIVAAIGEGSIYVFEQIYLGKKTTSDIDWVKQFMEVTLQNGLIERVTEAVNTNSGTQDKDGLLQAILKLLTDREKA